MEKKQLQKYLSPLWPWVGAAVCLVLVLVSLWMPGTREFRVLVGFGCAVALGGNAVRCQVRLSRQMKALEDSGALEEALRDFQEGKEYFGGRLRAGKNYLFGKGYGLMVPYSKIGSIYQFVGPWRFWDCFHCLRVKPLGEEHYRNLCGVPRGGKADGAVTALFTDIRKKAPGARVGRD